MKYGKYFTMSFDDGTIQDRRFVEIIDRYNLKCTFNLNSGLFGKKHRIMHDGFDVCHDEIEENEVKELYKNHEIAVHTVTHPNLLKCSKERIISEVNDDYEKLTQLSGKEDIIGMAYPGGPYYDENVIATILENTKVRYARTVASTHSFDAPTRFMEWHPTACIKEKEVFSLAEQFIDAQPNGADMLFYVWGHSFELDKHKEDWSEFERFCKLISGKDDINYVTNGEFYRHYISAKI